MVNHEITIHFGITILVLGMIHAYFTVVSVLGHTEELRREVLAWKLSAEGAWSAIHERTESIQRRPSHPRNLRIQHYDGS